MRSRTPPRAVAGVAAVLLASAFAGCTRSDSHRVQVADVERCERGVEAATREPHLASSLSTYHRECADVYKEPACREAFIAAGLAAPEKRLAIIAEECRKAYCPIFADRGLELCQGGSTRNAAMLERNWGHLHDAILEHDAEALAPRISRAMSAFSAFARTKDAQDASGAPSAGPSAAPKPTGSAH